MIPLPMALHRAIMPRHTAAASLPSERIPFHMLSLHSSRGSVINCFKFYTEPSRIPMKQRLQGPTFADVYHSFLSHCIYLYKMIIIDTLTKQQFTFELWTGLVSARIWCLEVYISGISTQVRAHIHRHMIIHSVQYIHMADFRLN